tara:strand:- start:4889 stop:5002 length:114 start_codon:yes stop_codon:yes gene_type:complete
MKEEEFNFPLITDHFKKRIIKIKVMDISNDYFLLDKN